MNTIDLYQLKDIRTGEKASEDRYDRDRTMYLRGRCGSDASRGEALSDRDKEMYMMGHNVYETLGE